jgi:hypothetical protein
VLEGEEKRLCVEHAERVVKSIKEKVFPIHGI